MWRARVAGCSRCTSHSPTRTRSLVGFRKPLMQRAFFFLAEDGIRDKLVTGVQTCALPILAAGHGYERNGTVYFRVASDPGYGRLSGLTREQMLPLAADRGGHPEDPNKDDPLDFVLWQRSAPDEPWWE